MDTGSFELWLEFEHWERPWDPDCDAANVQVILSNGRKYALSVWTFAFLARARELASRDGENLNAEYLEAPDLFVRRLDRPALRAVFADLLETGGLAPGWEVPGADAS